MIPHKSVLLSEVIEAINTGSHGFFVDATFGAGGYSKKLLEVNKNCKIIAIDRDQTASKYADELNKEFNNRVIFVNDIFSNIEGILTKLEIKKIQGIMYDFGVSSMQLDEGERGFSFSKEAPLLMQMGINSKTAYDIVNFTKEEDLANLIFNYSDEKFSRKIAKNIVSHRKKSWIQTTTQLAEIIKSSIPKKLHGDTHPATRTFQAIRIAVNDEMNEIKTSLQSVVSFLENGSKIVCVSFHWLEDKIVKTKFRDLSGYTINPSRLEVEIEKQEKPKLIEIITKSPITPTEEEVKTNPRSRSALMRIGKKI